MHIKKVCEGSFKLRPVVSPQTAEVIPAVGLFEPVTYRVNRLNAALVKSARKQADARLRAQLLAK